MKVTYRNIYIHQGADFEFDFELEDENSDRIDLTDVDLSGQIRRTYASDTAYDFVIEKTDAVDGEMRLRVPATTNVDMGHGRYVYDVFGEDTTDGSHFKILEGIAEVIPRVTRGE